MRRVALAALLLFTLAAAPAGAESRPGTLSDPAGDAVAGGPDIAGVQLDYDTAGSVTTRITLTAAPAADSDALASVVVGTLTSSGACSPAFALGAALASSATSSTWANSAGTSGRGTRSLSGATLSLTAADAALGADADCLRASVQRIGGDQAVYDDTAVAALSLPDSDGDGVLDRDDACPSTGAPGQADGCPPAPAPTTPTTTTPPAPPPPVPPKPTATALERYDAAVAACPARRGTQRTACLARVAHRNAAGARLARKRPANPFLGKGFFRPDVDVANLCGGACLTGMVFPDDRWAYRGVPEKGPVLVRCTRTTAVGEKDGCLRYTLSEDHHTATVGGVRYRLTAQGHQITPSGENGGPLTRVAVPVAGTRVAAVINNITSFGTLTPSPVYNTSELTFAKDGRFVGAGATTGSSGQGGDFASTFTAIGPERRGHYAFEPGGTLSFTYDDGRVVRRSAFVSFGERLATGTVAADGLFLDGSAYLPPDD